MKPLELKEYLCAQIPIAQALGIDVVSLSAEGVELTAPLEANRNHLGTAFGGSLGSVMILACYAWMFNRLGEDGKNCHVVIQTAQTDYLKPVTGNLRAVCSPPDGAEIERMLRHVDRKGVARLKISSQIVDTSGEVLCRFVGDFVAHVAK